MNSLKSLDTAYDICVLGEVQTGKSSLILRFLHNKFIDLDSSVEDLYTKVIRSGQSYNQFTILDSSSIPDYYAHSKRKQLMNTATLMLVYAVDNYESFAALEDLYERVTYILQGRTIPPVVVVGTRMDQREAREVFYDEGQKFAHTIGAIKFVECSAKDGVCVEDAFQPLLDYITETRQTKAKEDPIVEEEEIPEEAPEVPPKPDPIVLQKQQTSKRASIIRPSHAQTAPKESCCVIV